MKNGKNKDRNPPNKNSLDSWIWIGLAIGVGVGAVIDNYIIGISIGVVLMLLIISKKPNKK